MHVRPSLLLQEGIFPSYLSFGKVWAESGPVLFQITSPNTEGRNNELPARVPRGLWGSW